jgi:chromosomal replication initiation ATPase DnaA
MSLQLMAQQICEQLNVLLDDVRSASRRRELTPARVAIARQAVDQRIASLREVGEFLGRNSATLSELLARHPR